MICAICGKNKFKGIVFHGKFICSTCRDAISFIKDVGGVDN